MAACGIGNPPSIFPTTLTPAAWSPRTAVAAIPNATAISGAGAFGTKRLTRTMTAKVPKATASSRPRGLRNMFDDRDHVPEVTLLVDVDAEQLWQLIDHNHQADSRLESRQDRIRNEIGQESEPKNPRSEEHRADENGERCRRGERIERRVCPQCLANRSCAQDRDWCGGADAKQAGGAKYGVNRHGQDRSEQSRLYRQQRNSRVGQRLWHDDCGGGQPRDQVVGEVPTAARFFRSNPSVHCGFSLFKFPTS